MYIICSVVVKHIFEQQSEKNIKKGKIMRTKKITLPLVLALAGAAFAANNDPMIAYYPFVKENAEMPQLLQNAYAYAPATVYYNGQYHQFYCSSGNMSDKYFQVPPMGLNRMQEAWDHIRYRSSKNGSDWSSPKIAIMQSPQESSDEPSRYYTSPYKEIEEANEIKAAAGGQRDAYFFPTKAENCACDPAIVNGDDGYWYMLYAGNIDNYNTVVYLARSKNIQGPYEKFSTQGWDRWAVRPTPVLQKKTNRPANDPSIYGIGQPTIVKKDGKFHVWFAEMDNVNFVYGGRKFSRRYHVAVNRLSDLRNVNLDNPSISNIKIDTLKRYERNITEDWIKRWSMVDFGEVRWTGSQYEMWILNKYMQEKSYIKKYTSDNAVDWVMDYTYSEGPYNFIHNIGVSGDMHGWVHNDQYLLSFSGPDVSLNYSREYLQNNGYGGLDVTSGMWPMWQKLNGMEWSVYNISYTEENTFDVKYQNHPKMKFFVGDFDGDGADELSAVDLSYSLWYLGSSRNANSKKSSIWGWSDNALSTKGNYKIVTGDYDGDGITDIGVVTYKWDGKMWNGYWNIRSSMNASIGVPNIPKNMEWTGLNENLVLLNGDYDGDGVVDLGAFYPNDKAWYILSGKNDIINLREITKTKFTPSVDLFGFTPQNINATNVVPVVGDFDGDHIADMTTVDVEKNQWYIQSSQTANPVSLRYSCGVSTSGEMSYWPLQMSAQLYPNVSAYPAAIRGCPVSTSSSGSYSPDNKFLAGDFDGDGVDDQMMIIMASGRAVVHLSKSYNPGENHMSRLNPPRMISFPKIKNLSSKEILVGDFDGNGYSDICVVDLKTYKYYIYFFSSETLFDLAGTGMKKSVTRQMKFAHPAAGSLRKESPRVQEEKQEPVPAQKVRNIAVRVQDMLLNVSNLFDGDDVVVMDVRGKEIARKTAHGAEVNITIPARGAYIVHVGKTNRLISVK